MQNNWMNMRSNSTKKPKGKYVLFFFLQITFNLAQAEHTMLELVSKWGNGWRNSGVVDGTNENDNDLMKEQRDYYA